MSSEQEDRLFGTHLRVPEIKELVSRWPVMWKTEVPDIGLLTCYGAPCCIVHVMDYIDGGFDMYVPVTSSLEVSKIVEALKTHCLPTEEREGQTS